MRLYAVMILTDYIYVVHVLAEDNIHAIKKVYNLTGWEIISVWQVTEEYKKNHRLISMGDAIVTCDCEWCISDQDNIWKLLDQAIEDMPDMSWVKKKEKCFICDSWSYWDIMWIVFNDKWQSVEMCNSCVMEHIDESDDTTMYMYKVWWPDVI